MSSETTTNSSGGIGFAGAFFLVLFVLKVTHVINWSWIWVTAPLWGSLAIFLIIVAFVLLVVGLLAVFDSK